MTANLKQYGDLQAGKLISFESQDNMQVLLKVEGLVGNAEVVVPLIGYFSKYPGIAAGGYYVEKPDGTQIFCAAAAFDELFGAQ